MSIELAKEISLSLESGKETMPKGLGDRDWTVMVKRSLIELGKSKGYRVCASGFPGIADDEWLYDVVWFNENDQGFLSRVPMICESEWGLSLSDVKYDFEKLLVSNAPIKLMICQTGKVTVDGFMKYFCEAIMSFNRSDSSEIYVLAIFNNDNFSFEYHYISSAGQAIV